MINWRFPIAVGAVLVCLVLLLQTEETVIQNCSFSGDLNSTTTTKVLRAPNRGEERSTYQSSNRSFTGKWIGNTWIPPHPWRLYDPSELRQLWAHTKVWWIGDSLARRGAVSLFSILNSSGGITNEDLDDPAILNVNRGNGGATEKCTHFSHLSTPPLLCRSMPGSLNNDYSFLVSMLPCALEVDTFLEEQMNHSTANITDFDVIVISIGPWELRTQNYDCRGKGKSSNLNRDERMAHLVNTLEKFAKRAPGVQVVWKTSGYGALVTPAMVDAMNQQAMNQIDKVSVGPSSNLSYVNWGGAVRPRSLGKNRIQGDSLFHYGVEPRHVLVQMLTNHLVQRGALP